MRIAKFRKAPADRKRYVINYSDWLNEDEILESVSMSGNAEDDEFYVDGYIIGETGKDVIFFVSGGVDCKEYDVYCTVHTSWQQIKEDYVTIVVT